MPPRDVQFNSDCAFGMVGWNDYLRGLFSVSELYQFYNLPYNRDTSSLSVEQLFRAY
jgi:hypothetical protein